MIAYLCVICGGAVLIAAGVSLGYGLKYLSALASVWLAIAIVILLDAITAALCRALPPRCVGEMRIYKVGRKEKNFYERLGIRKWKDSIPELGHFTGFRKNKISELNNERYLRRFIAEIRYGELGHFFSCFTGFATLSFFFLRPHWIAIAVPVSAVNAVLNLLPLFVLRYNGYKLEILLKSVKKRKSALG